ncbi:MAG: UDP-N-acetylmuramate:L-alanyl-gamma-D-glutamyl-meso-diaminopimelate ligase [Neisseria sp.]|nr:UDP-N-acetylmuramate:L-alanyl-gamma-D-glutamyl-meso-diaminopimelate ligase [Neisseria sp.]
MKHIHIIGIGGTFMGSLAALAQAAGFRVTGGDGKMYPPMSTQLETLGINAHEGFDAEQLDLYPADVYVIGNVAKRGMAVIESILNRHLPYISGPQWLAENILCHTHVLAVAGTHGKTTTASMLAWILEEVGLKPGFLIGGVPQNFGISARLPENDKPYFVIEADEYDTAFFDKRSKFVHYHARTAILNNLEYDHADIFPDLGAIQTQFHHLVRTVPSEGELIVNACEPNLQAVLDKGAWTPVVWFGNDQGYHAGEENADGTFTVYHGANKVGDITWSLSGAHNRMNALAAVAAAAHIGVHPEAACKALSRFENVKRRMECKGEVRGITVYDDFAHHPTAIRTTLEGLRRRQAQRRIIAVLEPRSNTMKQGSLKAALPAALSPADKVFCYAGGIDWDVAAALASLGEKVQVEQNFEIMLHQIAATAQSGDAIVVMSNGDFNGIHEKLLNLL